MNPAPVMSVVDTRTRLAHLVAFETVALHHSSGRYPALCGRDVLSASMTTAPIGDCEDCATAQRDELGKSTKNNGHT